MKIDQTPAPSARANEVVRLGATIPHKYLCEEAELITLKWPTYRFKSPWELNELFRTTYNDLCKNRRPRGLTAPVANLGGIGPKLNFEIASSQLTQLHRARQHADRTGMPYDEYLRFCFDFAERRKRGHLPRPNQLRPSTQSESAWFSLIGSYWTSDRYWVRLSAAPCLAQYTCRNEAGLPAQVSFREALLFLAESNEIDPTSFYARVVLANQWLQEEHLVSKLPEIWTRARERAMDDQMVGHYKPQQHVPLAQEDLMQSCYGVPGIDTAETEVCVQCPLRKTCDEARSAVLQRIQDRHGCNDPATEASRARNRSRVADFRARTKAATSVSAG